ncbi:MAG: IS110 family transposase [Chloroflexota bacterium]
MENTIKSIGMDVSDRKVDLCLLNAQAEIVGREKLANTEPALKKWFSGQSLTRVSLEAGTHSRWISSLLEGLGHEVIVANPRKLRAIYESDRKTDLRDAEMLARLGLADKSLLSPIRHRGRQAHADLSLLHARDQLVQTRTKLVTHVRGVVKAFGARIKACSTATFDLKARQEIPQELKPALFPILDTIAVLTEKIRAFDGKIEALAQERYPESQRLRQIKGVGFVVSLAYVLLLEDPSRFKNSRQVGAYLGLTTRQSQSGEKDRRSRITKAGDSMMRRLLVQSATRILGPFGADSDLRRWGLAYSARGGPSSKKRARIAVSRKLAVLMHALWKTGQAYEPLRNQSLMAA